MWIRWPFATCWRPSSCVVLPASVEALSVTHVWHTPISCKLAVVVFNQRSKLQAVWQELEGQWYAYSISSADSGKIKMATWQSPAGLRWYICWRWKGERKTTNGPKARTVTGWRQGEATADAKSAWRKSVFDRGHEGNSE